MPKTTCDGCLKEVEISEELYEDIANEEESTALLCDECFKAWEEDPSMLMPDTEEFMGGCYGSSSSKKTIH